MTNREIDLLIAKEVMKYDNAVIACPKCNAKDFYECLTGQTTCRLCNLNLDWHKNAYRLAPAYTEDIVAAWEVVEKLKKDKNIHMIDIFWDVDTWYCHIWKHSDKRGPEYDNRLSTGEDSCPLVICKAALLAVGVGV